MISPVMDDVLMSVAMISAMSCTDDSCCNGALAAMSRFQSVGVISGGRIVGAGCYCVYSDSEGCDFGCEAPCHEVDSGFGGEVWQVVVVWGFFGCPVSEEYDVPSIWSVVSLHTSRRFDTDEI